MVNVIIYLKKEFQAEELVKFLLSEKLIASASIDENNASYIIFNGNFQKEVYNVITAKSKSLLLNRIITAVEKRINDEVLITSSPIVGTNKFFHELIIKNTIQI